MELNLLTTDKKYNQTFCARQKCISKSALEALISQNKTNREIAALYSISAVYVRQLRQSYGLPCERIPFPKEVIANLVSEGKTDRQIAAITGLSYEYAANLRRSLGLAPSTTAIPKSKIEPLINEGKSNNEIADVLGISLHWFKQLKQRYGFSRIKSQVKIDEEQVKFFIMQGKTDMEISQYFGGGRLRRIGDIRRNLGLKHEFRKKPTDPSLVEMFKKFVAEGMPTKEIAKKCKRSLVWVYAMKKKYQI